MKRERRLSPQSSPSIERGAEGGQSRTVTGYALVFDSESVDLGGFTERIARGALDGVVEVSDVLCVWNHDASRGVLARSRQGEGSLSLDIDEKGLRYQFEAPKTALGDELLESLRRGDIDKSSFCFTVADDVWEKRSDGSVLRTINRIERLYDVSPVLEPAYPDTLVVTDTRGLDQLDKQEDSMKKNERSKEDAIEKLRAILAELEGDAPEEKPDEGGDEQCAQPEEGEEEQQGGGEEPQPQEGEGEQGPEEPEEEEKKPDEQPEEKGCGEGEDDKENKSNVRQMKRFSLIQSVRDILNRRSFNPAAAAVDKEGRAAMQRAGLDAEGHIVLPFETRAADDIANPTTIPAGVFATIDGQGSENVPEDKLSILEPLRAQLILAQAGCTIMDGLVGNVSIPTYSSSKAYWAGEYAESKNGEGEWDEITLSPKRITSYIDVSRQFLLQDSNGAEALIRRDLIESISQKIESTVLGSEAGSALRPAGIFNGVTADTAAVKYADIVGMEETLENQNVSNYCYIMNPSARATLRTTSKDTGSGMFIIGPDGEIEGRKVLVSSNVKAKGVAVGDWSDYVIGFWGGVSIVVDELTLAREGKIRLVVNAYVDCKPRRQSFIPRVLK